MLPQSEISTDGIGVTTNIAPSAAAAAAASTGVTTNIAPSAAAAAAAASTARPRLARRLARLECSSLLHLNRLGQGSARAVLAQQPVHNCEAFRRDVVGDLGEEGR